MGLNSKIEWTENTFNPWIGCTRISPACDHCYAADLSARTFKVKWGAGEARKRTSESYWKQPLKWNAEAERAQNYYEHVSIASSGATQDEPRRPRVFCASLADVFDNEVPVQWRADLFELIAKTPNLDWMILTKRIGNVTKLVNEVAEMERLGSHEGHLLAHQWRNGNPPENVRLGITICNQAEADRDVPKLLITKAEKRFLSIEPMLGAIDIKWALSTNVFEMASGFLTRGFFSPGMEILRRIDLVIAGGESGPQARPSHPDWFRSLRDQCASAGVPYMFKQWGEYVEWNRSDIERACCFSPSGRWHDGVAFVKVGKKAAGRLLDGAEHNGRIA